MSNCFNTANILLPNDDIDMEKWSVIACDQFTSQADYWDAVEKYVEKVKNSLFFRQLVFHRGKDARWKEW